MHRAQPALRTGRALVGRTCTPAPASAGANLSSHAMQLPLQPCAQMRSLPPTAPYLATAARRKAGLASRRCCRHTSPSLHGGRRRAGRRVESRAGMRCMLGRNSCEAACCHGAADPHARGAPAAGRACAPRQRHQLPKAPRPQGPPGQQAVAGERAAWEEGRAFFHKHRLPRVDEHCPRRLWLCSRRAARTDGWIGGARTWQRALAQPALARAGKQRPPLCPPLPGAPTCHKHHSLAAQQQAHHGAVRPPQPLKEGQRGLQHAHRRIAGGS